MLELKQLQSVLVPLLDDGVCLAFSGGCDSTLLLAVLSEMADRDRFLPVMASGLLQTEEETARARSLAEKFHTELVILTPDVLSLDAVRMNRRDRCYHCKKYFFEAIRSVASERSLKHVIDGTNADDLLVYRPGRKALEELNILSPLAMAGLTKSQVRALAAQYDEAAAQQVATPCLATRFPYDTPLEVEALTRVASAERSLRSLLPEHFAFRVRCHGSDARLELEDPAIPLPLEQCVKDAGFDRVTIDPEPFRSGSFDRREKLS